MDWKDILKNAITTTAQQNFQVDDDYSDLEEEYDDNCKKRLIQFMEACEKVFMDMREKVMEKSFKVNTGKNAGIYAKCYFNKNKKKGDKADLEIQGIRLTDGVVTFFGDGYLKEGLDKLTEEEACDIITALKEADGRQYISYPDKSNTVTYRSLTTGGFSGERVKRIFLDILLDEKGDFDVLLELKVSADADGSNSFQIPDDVNQFLREGQDKISQLVRGL